MQLYIIDFLIGMIRVKENDPLFIYLLMNIVFIGVAMTMFTGTAVTGIAIGFGLYLFSMSMRSLRLERVFLERWSDERKSKILKLCLGLCQHFRQSM